MNTVDSELSLCYHVENLQEIPKMVLDIKKKEVINQKIEQHNGQNNQKEF